MLSKNLKAHVAAGAFIGEPGGKRQMDNQDFKEWCGAVKARREFNNSPAGHARLATLIDLARNYADDLYELAGDIEHAADGIGRGLHYAKSMRGAVDGVVEMLDCVEEQLERAREAQDDPQ